MLSVVHGRMIEVEICGWMISSNEESYIQPFPVAHGLITAIDPGNRALIVRARAAANNRHHTVPGHSRDLHIPLRHHRLRLQPG